MTLVNCIPWRPEGGQTVGGVGIVRLLDFVDNCRVAGARFFLPPPSDGVLGGLGEATLAAKGCDGGRGPPPGRFLRPPPPPPPPPSRLPPPTGALGGLGASTGGDGGSPGLWPILIPALEGLQLLASHPNSSQYLPLPPLIDIWEQQRWWFFASQ